MTREKNQKTVILLQDFARKKAGEEFTADALITTSMVNRGVARNKTEEELQSDSTLNENKSSSKAKKQK